MTHKKNPQHSDTIHKRYTGITSSFFTGQISFRLNGYGVVVWRQRDMAYTTLFQCGLKSWAISPSFLTAMVDFYCIHKCLHTQFKNDQLTHEATRSLNPEPSGVFCLDFQVLAHQKGTTLSHIVETKSSFFVIKKGEMVKPQSHGIQSKALRFPTSFFF